ncbi:phage scaffolding protein [Hathewaya histolytica]|uniref:Phage minor structural protein GP20 n=1 Tax=Hathewaya histolytica TaxID=1498 RepID=A0A4U9RCK6_HATHI|nr:phage scaffolding protein [Hathewaya histolytica]VTQ88708.1 phage minor structural protein GP20 [Hathewaya histolytica]
MAKLKEILGEELFNKLPEDKQKEFKDKDLEDISGGAYIPKQRFDQINEQAKEYKKQVGERDQQITKFKEDYKDVDGLKEKVSELEEINKKQKEDYESKTTQMEFDYKFDKAIGAYKTKNPKALRALLDMDKVKLVDDTFIGLEEQVKALKESDSYLFEDNNLQVTETIVGTGVIGGGQSLISNINNTKTESLGERLAKEKSEQLKGNEQLDNFFK